MGWSPELCIGEFRPWPESICVVRDKTDETRRYVPEEMLVRMELHECPACANVADLQDVQVENAKLRELVSVAITYCVNGYCGKDDGCPLRLTDYDCQLLTKASGLGVEVDDAS